MKQLHHNYDAIIHYAEIVNMHLGQNSQNLFFVTLGLKILRLFRLKVLFVADVIAPIFYG